MNLDNYIVLPNQSVKYPNEEIVNQIVQVSRLRICVSSYLLLSWTKNSFFFVPIRNFFTEAIDTLFNVGNFLLTISD